MNWQNCILDFLRIVIWPALIFWTIRSFKKEIASVVVRVYQLKFPGLEFNVAQQKEQQNLNVSEPENKECAFKNDESSQELIAKAVQDIKSDYEMKESDTRCQIENLYKEIAFKDIMLDFERIYNMIFGSQINLLEILKTSSLGYNESEMALFFCRVRGNYPALSNWNIYNYLSFLIHNNLIKIDNAGLYQISDKGESFVTYITNMKYIKNKIL